MIRYCLSVRRPFLPPDPNKEELIASFGAARLVRYLDGTLAVRGGTLADRIKAREWIVRFMPGEKVKGLDC